jgi:hypothetical protein
MELVYVQWEDVTSSGADWYEEEEMEKWKGEMSQGFIVEQVGFVLEENKKYILLCSHYHANTDIAPAQYGHLQKILKSLIIKKKVIKV